MDAMKDLLHDQADRNHPGKVAIWEAIRDAGPTAPDFVRSALVSAIEAIDYRERRLASLAKALVESHN